jgi:aminoglycoside phosphotransferase (APT) family kinase protein
MSDGTTELRRSSRDHEEIRRRLEAWLATRLPAGAVPTIASLEGTSANGMSSETLLFDARWTQAGVDRFERLVARVAPDADDVPVFPSYDLVQQYEAIRKVGELTSVPVPPVWWSEPDPVPIGAPFFVMGRVDGQVPPDVMPYNFGDSWLFDASTADQRRLQDSTVAVLAELHGIDRPGEQFAFLDPAAAGDTPLRRRVARTRDWYDFAAAGGFASPLIERCFAWLDDHWPSHEGPTVVCWGDARIGNAMYRDFVPVAVLDWEMATLGPRELDVAWLVYGHRIFEDIAASLELPGMPHFLRRDDVAATYESLTGHTPRDLDFYGTYAALQYGIVFLRTGHRQVHFGEIEMPADVDDLIMNREPLERMLAGAYWT